MKSITKFEEERKEAEKEERRMLSPRYVENPAAIPHSERKRLGHDELARRRKAWAEQRKEWAKARAEKVRQKLEGKKKRKAERAIAQALAKEAAREAARDKKARAKWQASAWDRPAFDTSGRPTGLLQTVVPKTCALAQKLKSRLALRKVKFISALARDVRKAEAEGNMTVLTPLAHIIVKHGARGGKKFVHAHEQKLPYALIVPLEVTRISHRSFTATLAREPKSVWSGYMKSVTVPYDIALCTAVFHGTLVVFHDRLALNAGHTPQAARLMELQDGEHISVYAISHRKKKTAK